MISSLGPPSIEWATPLPDYNKITFNIQEDAGKRSEEWRSSVISRIANDQVSDLVLKLCRYTDRLNHDQVLTHPCFESLVSNGLDENRLFKPTME